MSRRAASVLVVTITLGALAAFAVWTSSSQRVREVVPGRLYRSGQLGPGELQWAAGRWQLQTVLNLRGAMPGEAWYEAEREIAKKAGLHHVDLRMSADRLPSRAELIALIGYLDEAEEPLLVHCLGGADRSGLAEALAILLAGGEVAAARDAMRVRFAGVTAAESPLVAYIDQYEAWLQGAGVPHDAARARRYALSHYVPEVYGASLGAISLPTAIRTDQPHTARFRVENTSARPWQLTDGRTDHGIHLGLRVERVAPGPIPPCEARAETTDSSLEPGAAIELAMNLPLLREAGRYRLTFDMVNESEAWFAARGGSQPIVIEFDVDGDPMADERPVPDGFVSCDRSEPGSM